MVKKISKRSSEAPVGSEFGSEFTGTIKESARQIWLAGLGAFSKAQSEGGKVFKALVKQGSELQRKTQSAAEEKLSEASVRMTSMANEISSKASGQWDKLENIFEDRVAKALNKLGVPSAKDISELTARIDELNRTVQKLSAKPALRSRGAKPAAPATSRTAARRAPRKPA